MKTRAAAKGRRLSLLAAVCLISTLLAVPTADASRSLPAALAPALAPPAPAVQVFENEVAKPQPSYRLFGDLSLPERPLELVQIQKTASGFSTCRPRLNIWQTGGLSQNCSGPSFQGLWTDPVTGIAYARNRWYDARNASWLSEDPMGAVDSPNLYAFVGWGPHVGTDPMGECLFGIGGTCAEWADAVGGKFDQWKRSAQSVGEGGFVSTTVDFSVTTALDLTEAVLVDPLRVGDATGTAIGEDAGALDIGLSVVQDVGRGAAIAGGSGAVIKSVGKGATALRTAGRFDDLTEAVDDGLRVAVGELAQQSGRATSVMDDVGRVADDVTGRGVGRGNQMPFANNAEDLVSGHTGVSLNRTRQTIPGSGPGGVRIPDFPVRGPQGSVRLRGSVMEVKASRLKNFGDLSSRSRAQILDAVAYARRLRARSGMVRNPQTRAILENAHVEIFSDLAAPTSGRFYRLMEQGLIKWSPIPR